MKTALRLIPVCLALVATSVSAHGLDGQSFERADGGYVVGVTSDLHESPQAGSPSEFEFRLFTSDSRAALPFTDAVVTIKQNGVTTLTSDLVYTQEGSAELSYLFPQGGAYDLSVSFHDALGTGIAQSHFVIQLGGENRNAIASGSATLELVALSILCGFGLGALVAGGWLMRKN